MLEYHIPKNVLELIKRFVENNTYLPVDPSKRRVKEIEKQSIIDSIDKIKATNPCGANDEMQAAPGDWGISEIEIEKWVKEFQKTNPSGYHEIIIPIKCKFCGKDYTSELDHLDASPSCDNKQTEEDVDSGLMDHGSPVFLPSFLKTKSENL